MSTHKSFDRICIFITVFSLLLTVLFMNGEALHIARADRSAGYESTLFDTGRVHKVEIVIDDWDAFLEDCESEEYSACAVVIDGESVKNVAIRAKGNTSLSTVSRMGSSRYSFKLEFDHYEKGKTYRGLDKLCLNNIIQDNTYMKDYLAYRMMAEFGADAPLCSFVWITVNGEDWGLYLAVEAVEESFLERVYGGRGDLYKPDSLSFGGGGPGGGRDFNMEDFLAEYGERMGFPGEQEGEASGASQTSEVSEASGVNQASEEGQTEHRRRPEGSESSARGEAAARERPPQGFGGQPFDGFGPSSGGNAPRGGGGGMGMGSDDVKLRYTDDDPESYSNIFGNAKTTVTDADRTRLIQSLQALASPETAQDALDAEEVLRYFVVHNFTVNGDSYTGSMIHNYYLHEQDGRLAMIPWDYNLAFGTFQASDAAAAINDPIDTPLSVSGDGSRPMADWIFQSEEATERYHELFAEFLDSVDVLSMIDETAALIAPWVEKDPTAFCTAEEFETGVDALRTFCEKRIESVRGQLDGTIPSTDDGQRTDDSALIDAGELKLSALGSMGGGMGGGNAPGMGGGFGRRSRSESGASSGEETAGSSGGMPELPEGFSGGMPELPEGFGDMPELPEGFGGGMPELPEGFGGEAPGASEGGSQPQRPARAGAMTQAQQTQQRAILLGTSAAVLLAGLVIAMRAKGRML